MRFYEWLYDGPGLLTDDLSLRIDQRLRIVWKDIRWGKSGARIYIDNPLIWGETPHRSRIFRSILLRHGAQSNIWV